MGLFDKIKNLTRKEEDKKEIVLTKEKAPKKEDTKKVTKTQSKGKSSSVRDSKKGAQFTFSTADIGESWRVLKSPRISEKATDLAEVGKYVFNVNPKTTKISIKEAIQKSYGVTVTAVNIINIPRKKRRMGRREGYKAGYKKAIVSVKKGQTIEVLPQ